MWTNSSLVLGLCAIFAHLVSPAPTTTENRAGRALNYFDYGNQDTNRFISPFAANEYPDYEENDISRTVPRRKKIRQPYESPIYYIRLPPQPYMYVPGLGYISEPAPSPPHMPDFVNLPVNFLSNGKPSNIYQWNAALDFQSRPKPTVIPQDSNVHRVPGDFVFNGKPNDIYVLRDSYNSLYSDALQNFYP